MTYFHWGFRTANYVLEWVCGQEKRKVGSGGLDAILEKVFSSTDEVKVRHKGFAYAYCAIVEHTGCR